MTRNPNWPEWYTSNQVFDRHVNRQPYGLPAPSTLEFLKVVAGRKILDVAGGYGRYALPLATLGNFVTLMDIDDGQMSTSGLSEQQASVGMGTVRGLKIDVANTDAWPSLPVFDAALCAGLLEFAPRRIGKRILSKMLQVTRPGGAIVTEVTAAPERAAASGSDPERSNDGLYLCGAAERKLVELYDEVGIAVATARHSQYLGAPYHYDVTYVTACGQMGVG